jgi:DNA invertase Pin-like site-specific DNA recombinase
MALLGYCRVSTERQSLDQQVDALSHAGVERIFTDKRSGAREDRDGLTELLAYARPGDTIVVWRLDRLGRSLSHIVRTVADLQARGIYLRALQDGADSSTSTGRMMIGILASLAEYERELINERSAAAREAARDRGRHVGRPAALTADQVRQLRALREGGESVQALMRTFGVSRATIYRAINGESAAA